MVTLGEFLGLIENFYDDAAVVQVFNNDLVAVESDGLRDDILGFTFAISVGDIDTDGTHCLSPIYANAEIKSIYVCKKRVIKVLVQPKACHP